MQQEDEVQEIRSMRRNEPRITRKKKQQMQEEENKDEDDEEDDVPFIGSKKRKQSTSPITKGKKEKVEKQEEQEDDDVTVLDGKPSRVQYRSTLASIVSLLQNNLGEQFVKKYDNNILSVVQTYQRYEGKFNLGKKSVALTHDDIALIFGITSGNTKIRVFIQKRKPNSNFVNRNFEGTTTMAYSLMRTRITSLIKSTSKLKKKKGVEDESTKDLARLLTLYVLGTVFFKTTGPSLNWAYVPLVENLEECSTYAWSRYITDYLINELDSKYTNPWAVGGCTVALLYWLCEHAKIMEPVEPHIPRFMKWNVNELDAKLAETPVNSFSPEMVIDSQLQSTDEERRLYTFLSTDETEAEHPETTVDKETVRDQVPEQNLQILISELQKQIHLLESENKKLKDEIAEREIREQQKDNNIGRLLHLLDKLRRRLERYGKEATAYEEIEKENMSAKFEAKVL
ncbi:hypothetical protein Vadar_013825 [Vaccinium darrowii]|uniref:Uncharacterized protein n=1 Tax=Vaccinium darrowii TaxID=229202 RepID=A0ACB7Z3X2_9ERIC|nr:hypothetical protein Vadar_013825 [Vaccinium darrowii]